MCTESFTGQAIITDCHSRKRVQCSLAWSATRLKSYLMKDNCLRSTLMADYGKSAVVIDVLRNEYIGMSCMHVTQSGNGHSSKNTTPFRRMHQVHGSQTSIIRS